MKKEIDFIMSIKQLDENYLVQRLNIFLTDARDFDDMDLGENVSTWEEAKIRCAPGGDIYTAFFSIDESESGCTPEDWQEYWFDQVGRFFAPDYAEQLKKHYPYDTFANSDRRRMANDYKNTDAILKWQDNHCLAKATWKRIKRHMPFPYNPNYGNLPSIDTDGPLYYVNDDDPPEVKYNYFASPLNMYAHRNQKLITKEVLLGRRDTAKNLEWGWSLNYLKQDKDYYVDNWEWIEKNHTAINTFHPNSLWSDFCSRRLGAKFDGTYKAGDRHLIEFLIDGSKEKMDLNGWRMLDYDHSSADQRNRWRNYYEQKIFNAQVQDTITLNKQGDFWLTPSLRYNRSTIMGRSERYKKGEDP